MNSKEFFERLYEFDALDLKSSRRSAFLTEYSAELLDIMIALDNKGIVAGGLIHLEPPEKCDLCGILF